MIYYANYYANNGTCMMKPMMGTNYKKLVEEIREIANGNRQAGNTCKWSVWDEEDNVIKEGGTNKNGVKYIVPKEKIAEYNKVK